MELVHYLDSSLLDDFFIPTKTHTFTEEIQLKDIDFPINMKICVRPGLNNIVLEQLGYRNFEAYLSGVSRFNSSVIGWGGHTKESRALMASAKEVLDTARTNGIKNLRKVYCVDIE